MELQMDWLPKLDWSHFVVGLGTAVGTAAIQYIATYFHIGMGG